MKELSVDDGIMRHRDLLSRNQLLLLDTTVLTLAWALAWTLRFEGLGWLVEWRRAAGMHLALSIPLWLGVLTIFQLYRRIWSLASIEEVESLIAAVAIGAIANVCVALFVLPLTGLTVSRLPLSVVSSFTMWSIVGIITPRISQRLKRWRSARRAGRGMGERVLVLGAGSAGQLTAREMRGNDKLRLDPIGFLDDDAKKHGHSVAGLTVFGPISSLADVVARERVTHVVIAMPSVAGTVVREIVRICAESGVTTRTVPAISEILSGRVGVSQLRPVEIQDLLRRDPVQTDLRAVSDIATGHTVLVTGAGGSIGGELCRQLARHQPAAIVLVGHGENSIYEIHHELQTTFPAITLHNVIADIRDVERIDCVMERYKPHVVFHAAAHKHVPLMEENLVEAITNNVHGTRTVVESAARHGVPHFVMVSSDKAVNPTSIMGATKRIAELIVQRTAEASGLNYVSVRFGNVLGSRGSVVPMFLRQIRAGGPVTITHPDMTRYFMTIPEAVQLVLQAAVMGKGAEVFVLDMGEPVRIEDLAKDLIRLSGLRLGQDIDIRYTGLRAGEKLFEELSRNDESLRPTSHGKVLSARLGRPAPGLLDGVDALVRSAIMRENDAALRARVARLVPEYRALGTDHLVARAELTLVA